MQLPACLVLLVTSALARSAELHALTVVAVMWTVLLPGPADPRARAPLLSVTNYRRAGDQIIWSTGA